MDLKCRERPEWAEPSKTDSRNRKGLRNSGLRPDSRSDRVTNEELNQVPTANSQEPEQDRRKLARRGLRIGRTSVGKGVFATKRIPYATCIGEIEGVIHDYSSWESRYSFDLEDGRQLEPKAPFRYVNHSCQPNCNFQVVDFAEAAVGTIAEPDPRILLYASDEIWVGEELTIDYNWPLDFAIRCRCKAEQCRGWIVDPVHLKKLALDSQAT